MPVLGLKEVIPARLAEPGSFYLHERYEEDPVIFLCYLTGAEVEGVPEKKALYFTPDEEPKASIYLAPSHEPLIALNSVHVRVDAPSLSATSASSSIRSGTMFVMGDTPYFAAPLEFRHWVAINLSTGRAEQVNRNEPWATFDRWQLVLIDDEEEVVIANFEA